MENINYWEVFTSNFESRFVFCFVYLLAIASFDYMKYKGGRKKNSSETLRPDKKTQESAKKKPITNNIDPKTMMSNYAAPKQEIIVETQQKVEENSNSQKETSLNIFNDMMKEEENKVTKTENIDTQEDQIIKVEGKILEDREKEKQEKLRLYKIEEGLKAEKIKQEALEYGEEVY